VHPSTRGPERRLDFRAVTRILSVAALCAGFFLFPASETAAEYDPPAGGEALRSLVSPYSTARGESVVLTDSPRADVWNPAASGLEARTVLDAGYLYLGGPDGGGPAGHAGSVAASHPTRFGTFSSGLSFLTAPAEQVALGTTLGVRAGYSRDVYDDLMVGAGLNLDFGGTGDHFDVGTSVDLGVLRPVDEAPIPGLRWGAALRGIGFPYRPMADHSGAPSTFTPAVGLGFTLLDEAPFHIDMNTDLAFPAFRNARMSLGAGITAWDVVSLQAGWTIDAGELLDQERSRRSLVPSAGLSVTISPDQWDSGGTPGGETGTEAEPDAAPHQLPARSSASGGRSASRYRNELETRAAFAPLYGGTWTAGGGVTLRTDTRGNEPPTIDLEYDEPFHLAPNNSGVNDYLELPLSITEGDALLEGYRLVVLDDSGEPVRTMETAAEWPEARTVRTFFDRLTRLETGIDAPSELRWHGTDDEGRRLPDGEYRFFVEAWDKADNIRQSREYDLVIDTTAPSAEVSTAFDPDRRFSPNGDGNRDVLPVEQSGTSEDLWIGQMIDSEGQTVRTWRWEGDEPEPFEWDALNDDGEFVEDGVYAYELSSTDRAGNRFRTTLSNIIVDTEPTPVSVGIDRRFFAPNDTGRNDEITFDFDVPVTAGLLEWKFEVIDGSGDAIYTKEGDDADLPAELVFDGRLDSGERIAEGEYVGRFRARYRNGNEPVAESPEFIVDVTPPDATIRGETRTFSPTGDGHRDTMIIYQEASTAKEWVATVRNSDGEVVYRRSWIDRPPFRYQWDGRGDDGTLLPDDEYTYQISGEDRAGNRGDSNEISFRLDTTDTPVLLTVQHEAFSPNGTGDRDTIALIPRLEVTEGILEHSLRILDDDGEAVRTFAGGSRVPDRFVWDGYDRHGRRAAEGEYQAELEVHYDTDVVEQAQSSSFLLDVTPPEISVSANNHIFSPDGSDGRQSISFRQESSEEQLWEGRIIRIEDDRVVRSFRWEEGRAESFDWDGRDDEGNVVSDGAYRYEVRAEDSAGNQGSDRTDELTVDTRPTRVFVTADKTGFAPTGNDIRDEVTFRLLTHLTEGIEHWEFRIRSQTGEVVRTFEGSEIAGEHEIVWDGTTDDGEPARDGTYRANYRVRYKKGNEPTARTPELLLVTTPPDVDVELDPVPFAPDGDGDRDELFISIDTESRAEIADWSLAIRDRNDNHFRGFSGSGHPASELVWDGRGEDGSRVISAEVYPYELTVRDVLGNVTTTTGEIPVDVLVHREGDRLFIQIPSITFEPESPRLILDPDHEHGEQNVMVIKRLGEIFTRFEDYAIQIEGHAVNLSGTQREEQERRIPLSEARAESVKQALVDEGIEEDRMTTVGRGGREPIVPHDDLEERWRNRRVEFVLIR